MKKFLKTQIINNFKIGKWLPVFLWAGVIFFFSSLPQQKVTETFFTDFLIKKFAHISEYAILFALVFRANEKKFLITFAFVILYAISDEIHQSFVPGRSPLISDIFVFDLSGAISAAYCLWKLQQIRPNKPKK